MTIKTSLRPEVLNRLPFDKKRGEGIYHRPQEGSALFLKGGLGESINKRVSAYTTMNGKRVQNPAEFRRNEYENPHVNALKAFQSQPMLDNFYQTRRLVLTFNHGASRRDFNRIGQYRIAYYQTLADCNKCYFCKKPIKVRTARITSDSRQKPDSFFADETPLTKLDKRIDGGKRIRSYGGKALSGLRYKPHALPTNVVYGDIRSHFEYVPYKNEQGEVKYRFVYIDGSHRRIEQRKRENSVLRYFVHVQRDGTEKEIIPNVSYRITGKVCKCKRGKR